jgi:tetratricopeptide (TPR) repeat protein
MKQLVQFSFFIFLGLGIASCGDQSGKDSEVPQDSADSIQSEADSIQSMLTSLSQQIQMYPKNPALYIERSYLLYTSGDTRLAITDVEKAISLNPKDPEAYYLRGFYDLVSNRDSSAEKYLMKAVEYGSDNPETYYSLGNIETFKGKYAKALTWYQEAIRKDSADPAYPYACGMVFYQQKKYPQAIQWFEKSLQLDPYFTKSLLQLYAYYSDIRLDTKTAMKYNEAILRTDSLHPLGRFHKAAEIQDKAFKAGKKAGAGEEYEKLMMEAIEEYSKALIRNPGFVQALYNRGYAFYALEMYEEAMADFEKVLVSDQYHARSYFMIASIYEYKKDWANAKKYYEISLQLQPGFVEAEQAIQELSEKVSK